MPKALDQNTCCKAYLHGVTSQNSPSSKGMKTLERDICLKTRRQNAENIEI